MSHSEASRTHDQGRGPSAREEILSRVRAATRDVTSPLGARGPAPVIEAPTPAREQVLDLFAENVADYRAEVVRVETAQLATAIANALAGARVNSVVVPAGLPGEWLRHCAAARVNDDLLSAIDLDHIDAVITTAAVGIATTGTIVLDHSEGQGRRAVTLVPDVHVCVVRADQIVYDVPEGVRRLATEGRAGRPQTWISGPSATSDIELDRVEGVHGPRTLVVVLVS